MKIWIKNGKQKEEEETKEEGKNKKEKEMKNEEMDEKGKTEGIIIERRRGGSEK